MAATISDGTTTIYPTLVLGYKSTRTSRNLVHRILGGGIAVSLRSADLRSGTLQLFFPSEADAAAAEALHLVETSFTLADPDRLSMGMVYVISDGGEISRELDEDTRDHWVVSVDFQEVLS